MVYSNSHTSSDPSQGTLLGQETQRDVNHLRCGNLFPLLLYIFICSEFTCWCPTGSQSPWGPSKLSRSRAARGCRNARLHTNKTRPAGHGVEGRKKPRTTQRILLVWEKSFPSLTPGNQPFHLQHKQAGN